MVGWIASKRCGPIGVDVGSRSLKLVQLDATGAQMVEAARWELPSVGENPERSVRWDDLASALQQSLAGREFQGRNVVLCLGADRLFVQNIRIPKSPPEDVSRLVLQEVAGRLPFTIDQATVRFIETVDVRQGDAVKREVIVLACHQPTLDRLLGLFIEAGLKPVAVDVEPLALLRCYASQFRREEDRAQRVMFVHIGSGRTGIVIAEGGMVLFIKYVDIGGYDMDQSVAKHLDMRLPDAAALRRQAGDRKQDQRDPEIQRSLTEAIRGSLERLAREIEMCIRYHSVTFRGRPLSRVVLGGGEATQELVDLLGATHDLPFELGNPLRSFQAPPGLGRSAQWDIAMGLALREVN
jgi:type IV pilus assembly protein PilM